MKVEKKALPKSQIELLVELSREEFEPYMKKGAEDVAKEVKIEGFRPGKAPYEIIKQKVGEMTIVEAAARIAINKTVDQAVKDNLVDEQPIGQPEISVTKMAPGNPFEYKVVLALLPKVELGEYKNLEIKKESVEASEDDSNKLLDNLREMRVKEVLAEREAKEGDKAMLDINMYLDNIPVEGGQGKDAVIVIGREQVVPGFEKQIIGLKKGETKEFSLPYPADHYQAHLAGKMVEFKVSVKDIYERQLPELNDDFALGFGAKNIAELKENIKQNIQSQKQAEADRKQENEMLDKLVERTKFDDIPDLLIQNESRTMMHELEHEVANRGGKFEDYLASLKKTQDELVLELLPNAIRRVKAALLIGEVAKAENITADDEEVDKKIEDMIKQYKSYYNDIEDKIKAPGYKSYIKNMIVNEKVIAKLKEWNIKP